ncbi:hypothetical protein KJ765_03970 [Candidatus Micrarchaeota archaeon]|nr:hypothetical protein [Candidatus Micrarchaeota archaeon]
MAFWESEAGKIYNILLSRHDRVVSSDHIRTACKVSGVEFSTAQAGLARAEAIVPVVFRGVYYVKDREERDLGTIKEEAINVVARACNLKLKKNWYFGLATALKVGGISEQQTQTTITVITKKRIRGYRKAFAGMNIEFKQLSGVPFDYHIRKKGHIRFSDPSRTIVDYAYFGARNEKMREFVKAVLEDVSNKAGGRDRQLNRIGTIIRKYPNLYSIFLRRFFED